MSWLVIAVLAVASAACASEPLVQVDPATYRSELGAVCKQTDLQQAALTDPVDAATTAAFAQQVSTILTAEANATRALQVPADLDDDHRTFIQNTDDQARQWTVLASTSVDDGAAFGDVQTAILQLTLGRDDLAAAMGIDACRAAGPDAP
jgi:hypothetical protein|tara:strand:+ start:105 stop:554 length:450 start_codon:yes stop_codon:yes gene_type:complete